MKIKNDLSFKLLLAQIAGQPLRWIRFSWRVIAKTVHPQAAPLLQQEQPVIYALWHGRMYCLFKAVPLEKVAILVSPSNDGEFITRLARTIGFRHFIRGSHKRGGKQAIFRLRKALLENRNSIAFTVDGPRGPRYQVKPGIIRLASQTGVPIVPIGSSTRWLLQKFDRAWDHFHAPMPFTSMRLVYGEPLTIPPDVTEAQIAEYAKQLEAELLRVNQEADAQYGFAPESRL